MFSNSDENIKEIYLSKQICNKYTKINDFLDESIFNVKQKKNVSLQTRRLNAQHLQHVDIKPSLKKHVLKENETNSEKLNNVTIVECDHNISSLNLKNKTNWHNVKKNLPLNKEYQFYENGKLYNIYENRRINFENSSNKNEMKKEFEKNLMTNNLRAFLFGNFKSGKIPKKKSFTTAVAIKIKRNSRKKKKN